MKLELRPTLFGSQIEGVRRVLQDGCGDHAHTLAGVPDCRDCRIIELWEPELNTPVFTSSMPWGYVSRPLAPR